MRIKFSRMKRENVIIDNPWADVIIKFNNGFLCFETLNDYKNWVNKINIELNCI